MVETQSQRRRKLVTLCVLVAISFFHSGGVVASAAFSSLVVGGHKSCREFRFDPIVHATIAEIQEESTSRKENQPPRQWITCSSSKELAQAVSRHVQPGSTVAELGAQLRDVSTTICHSLDASGRAVLVDVVRKFPKNTKQPTRTSAMRRQSDNPNDFFPDKATFVEIGTLDEWRNALLEPGLKYDVFVLDVNAIVGNDLEWTSLSIVREFTALYPSCHTVLIKSVSLNQWASRLIHGQRWVDRHSSGGDNFSYAHPHIVATVGVDQYRQTIPYSVNPGDAVLEVGCHLGTSTALIHEQASSAGSKGYCIGVDVGSKIIQGARERHSELPFFVGDAWKTAQLLRIQQDYYKEKEREPSRLGFDVVYVDVGGLSGSDGLLEALSLISALSNALEPRCLVIKSLCMRRLSSILVPSWKTQSHGDDAP